MVAAAGPNWLGSPQHVAAGAVLALGLTLAASRWKAPWWLAALVAVGVTSAAEIALKFAEYLVKSTIYSTAYYDSLVDNTSTLAGAVVGTGIAVAVLRYRTRPS